MYKLLSYYLLKNIHGLMYAFQIVNYKYANITMWHRKKSANCHIIDLMQILAKANWKPSHTAPKY